MKTLEHKNLDMGMYDSDNGKPLKTVKAVDVTDDLPPGADRVILLYANTVRGEIVQIRVGSSRTRYFTVTIYREDNDDSAMGYTAMCAKITRAHLIELCLKNSPSIAAARASGTHPKP